ncbi:hypothetical protein [Sphaerisporangium sp. TRM90804]|uniref:hypothetical protein n=1 Tax=Sphaerisporangium sp. TRM90804 TaxID=3031113 RepID=UPI00244AB044|nr:hypothetical protein [Sphaerisporangium sp. TRM90804]MDH2427081.1 hypothetical protein [Sphaerisporangium sp. TRM90804]
MNVEDALKEAMAAQVADVHASPSLGQAVRRRHRRRLARHRAAGAAAVTVVVAGAIPAYGLLNSGPASTAGFGGSGIGTSVIPTTPPAGPDAKPMPGRSADGEPPATLPWDAESGAPEGAATPPPEGSPGDPTQAPPAGEPAVDLPQELGDLGDGRTFAGIHVGYLPEGLVWGEWSGKDGFGKSSATTSWMRPGDEPGSYIVQIIVFEGEAGERMKESLKAYRGHEDATPVKVRGARGVIANLGEGSEVTAEGTPTILWTIGEDIVVEAMMSPATKEGLGSEATERELKKIANGVRLAR